MKIWRVLPSLSIVGMLLVSCSAGGSASTETTAEATTTTLSAQQLRALAGDRLETVKAAAGSDTTWSEPLDIDDDVLAFSAPTDSKEAQVWVYDSGEWTKGTTVALTTGSVFASIKGFDVIDATSDGKDDLVITYWNVLDAAEIFLRDGEHWLGTGEVTNPTLTNAVLAGEEVYCLPDCTTPVRVQFDLDWTGLGFVRHYHDSTGTEITISDPAECAEWLDNDFPPLIKCNSGDAVIILQGALKEAGYLVSLNGQPPLLDGFFGPATAISVRLYQYAKGYPVTGAADGQWYYDLVDGYRARYAGRLPDFGAPQMCEDAMASVGPSSTGSYYYSEMLDTVQNCNRADWLLEVKKWRSTKSTYSDAWYAGGVDGFGHFILLRDDDATVKLEWFCTNVRYYYRYSIDFSTLLAC